MLKSIVILIIIFINLLIYNRLYFSYFRENIVFFKYFNYFIFFTFIEIILIIYFDFFQILKFDPNLVQSFIISYILMFLVIFFNICTKSHPSPTFIIYNLIKKKKKKYKYIINHLKKEKVIELRIDDLIKQKLIKNKKKKIFLTNNGKKFTSIYNFIKNFFEIKSEG